MMIELLWSAYFAVACTNLGEVHKVPTPPATTQFVHQTGYPTVGAVVALIAVMVIVEYEKLTKPRL